MQNWQQILADHGPAVWRTVRSLLGNEADARDCYQTVFLEAFQFSQREEVQHWTAFLKRAARMRALDVLRKRYRQAALIDSATSSDEAVSQLPSVESKLMATELGERLRACLTRLSKQQAEVFVMRYVDQLSYDEIALQIGTNSNAIGATLNRARKQLRRLLNASEQDSATDTPNTSSKRANP